MVHPKTDDDERHCDGNDSVDDRRGNCRGGDQVAYSVFLKVLGQAGERVVQLAGGFAGAVEVTKDQGKLRFGSTTSAGVRPASISVSASHECCEPGRARRVACVLPSLPYGHSGVEQGVQREGQSSQLDLLERVAEPRNLVPDFLEE